MEERASNRIADPRVREIIALARSLLETRRSGLSC
jgi:hypothetical protein